MEQEPLCEIFFINVKNNKSFVSSYVGFILGVISSSVCTKIYIFIVINDNYKLFDIHLNKTYLPKLISNSKLVYKLALCIYV